MGTSAKRLGLETFGDLELELRLRRIEIELGKRVVSNTDAAETGRGRLEPPRITGFAVSGQTPGTVTMKWSPSQIADLRRYQIQFAEDAGFSTNLQTFTTRDTSFTFSTASASGGASGTIFFTRVRVQNSIGQFSVYSVVINTATGQVVGGDLADDSVDTDTVADDAITADKIDLDSLVAALTLPGPAFDAGDSNKFVRVNSAASAYEFVAGTLPDLAASGDTGKLIRVAGSNNLDYTSYTFPAAATVANYFRGNGTNFLLREGTLPPLAAGGDVDNVVRVSAADTLAYFDQTPTDAAATAAGGGGTGANRTGTLALPGGWTIHWNTIDLANATATDVTVAGIGTLKNVIACFAEEAPTTPIEKSISVFVKDVDEITIEQNNTDAATLNVTYFIIAEQ